MSISHEEARKLIQFKADSALSLAHETKLSAHLTECADCSAYSNGLENTVSILRKTMHEHWSATPLPLLQLNAITVKVSSRYSTSNILTTRMALLGVAFVLFAFMAWQSVTSRSNMSRQRTSGMIPLIPTPSAQYTATNISMSACQNIKYNIQEGDTLEDVARQFSVPAASILLANNLRDASLESIQEIIIPICETTPTSTTYPPTFTITPIFEPATTTPG